MPVTVESVSGSPRRAARIGRRLATSCFALAAAVVVPASPASAAVAHRLDPVHEGGRAIWSPDLDKEYNLNVAGGKNNNGAHLILWHEPGVSQSNEQFYYPQASNTEIRVRHSAKCLGVYDESDGQQHVVQWSCNGNSDQKWDIRTDEYGHNVLHNVKYDKCMNVAGGVPGNNVNIILWACDGEKGNSFTPYGW